MDSQEPEFTHLLTPEEIDQETNKIEGFINQIPEELKIPAAINLVCEIVNWSCLNSYEGMGILYEAMSRFRDAQKFLPQFCQQSN